MPPTLARSRQSALGVPDTKTPHQRRTRFRVPKGAQMLIVTRTKRGPLESESSESRDDGSVIDISEEGEGSEIGSDKPWRDRSLMDNSQPSADKTELATGDVPNWIDQPEQFNEQVIEASKDYKKIIRLREASGSQQFNLRAIDDPDPDVKDFAVDKEVFERSAEGFRKWDAMWSKSGNKTSGFKIDYVVATGKRKLGDALAAQLLVKYSNYPVPSWESSNYVFKRKKSIVAEAYRVRLLDLDLIEIRLRAEIGDDEFAKTYPNRYLEHEEGKGRGGYVASERARYFNYLRAVEWRMSFVCARFDIAGVYVEDWTNGPCNGAAMLRLFKFVVHLMNSDFVERVVKEHKQLERVKCAAYCDRCDGKEDGQCCKSKCCAPSCRSHTASMVHFECTQDCRCDGDRCRNRMLQDGRQMVLCIFRHPEKGWSIRCVQELPKSQFVTEYVGEVNLHPTDGRGRSYDFPMQCPLRDEKGKRKYNPFVISTHKKGNEARFLNHSCNPNLETVMTVVERYGCFYHHIAFYTRRAIMAGEELTFNYFHHPLKDFDPKQIFRVCKCNSENCKFTAEKLRVIREKYGEEETEEEEEVEIVEAEKIDEDEEDEEESEEDEVEEMEGAGANDNIDDIMMEIFGPMTSDTPEAVEAASEKEKTGGPPKRIKRKSSKMIEADRDKVEKIEKKGRGRKTTKEEMRRKEEEKREKMRDSSSSPERNMSKKREARRKKIRSFGLMSEDELEERSKMKKTKKKEVEETKSLSKKKKNVPEEAVGWMRREMSPLEVMEPGQSFKNVVRMTVAGGMKPVVLGEGRWTADDELATVIRKSNRYSPSTSPTTSDVEVDCRRDSSTDRSYRTALGYAMSSPDPSLYSTRRRFRTSDEDDDRRRF